MGLQHSRTCNSPDSPQFRLSFCSGSAPPGVEVRAAPIQKLLAAQPRGKPVGVVDAARNAMSWAWSFADSHRHALSIVAVVLRPFGLEPKADSRSAHSLLLLCLVPA